MRLGLALAVASGVVLARCASPVPPSATVPPSAGPPASVVTIAAGGDSDVYHYQPSRVTVRANVPTKVEFVDRDVVDHTWTVFDSDGTTVLANLTVAKEGDVATGTFTFARAGTYSFWCTIPGHRGFGEAGTLTVVP